MLPPDRRYRSRRLRWDWRPLEAARNLVGGGSYRAVMELRARAEMIPRAVPAAVIDVTDFLELASWLLPLRLHFLITFVLRDRGRVTPESFCQIQKKLFQNENSNHC